MSTAGVKLVERPHRLPVPIRPYQLPSGRLADGGYEEFRVLLELDGRRYHDGQRRFRDWRRDHISSEDDWLTLRYGWHDTVGEPCLPETCFEYYVGVATPASWVAAVIARFECAFAPDVG